MLKVSRIPHKYFGKIKYANELLRHIKTNSGNKLKYSDCTQQLVKPSHCYWNSRAVRDHTVLPATRQRWHSCLYPSRTKLVLNLAHPEDATLSWLVTYRDCIQAHRGSLIPRQGNFVHMPNDTNHYAMPLTNAINFIIIHKLSRMQCWSVKNTHHLLSIGSLRANSTAKWQRFSVLLPTTHLMVSYGKCRFIQRYYHESL